MCSRIVHSSCLALPHASDRVKRDGKRTECHFVCAVVVTATRQQQRAANSGQPVCILPSNRVAAAVTLSRAHTLEFALTAVAAAASIERSQQVQRNHSAIKRFIRNSSSLLDAPAYKITKNKKNSSDAAQTTNVHVKDHRSSSPSQSLS